MPNNPNAIDNLTPFTGADDPRRGTKPKGAIHLSTRIQKMLGDDEFTVEEVVEGKKLIFKGNPAEAIIKTAILRAKNGDKSWADWLANNGYGAKVIIATEDPIELLLKRYGVRDDDGEADETIQGPPESST